MLITVRRIKSNLDATLSAVFVNDEFQCFGLEDEYREDKIPAETRIPQGVYDIRLRTVGGFHGRYSKKFDFHEGMLELVDVPNFKYVLIHIGNTDEDTAGCLLVGQGANSGSELSLTNSRKAYIHLYLKVISAAKSGNLKIEYIDEDM